jgi:hypothetical protein
VDMFFQNIYSEKSKFGKLIIMVLLWKQGNWLRQPRS